MAFRSVSIVASETSIITAEGHHRESGSDHPPALPHPAFISESVTQACSAAHRHETPTCRSRVVRIMCGYFSKPLEQLGPEFPERPERCSGKATWRRAGLSKADGGCGVPGGRGCLSPRPLAAGRCLVPHSVDPDAPENNLRVSVTPL